MSAIGCSGWRGDEGSPKKTEHNDLFSCERGLSMLTGRRYQKNVISPAEGCLLLLSYTHHPGNTDSKPANTLTAINSRMNEIFVPQGEKKRKIEEGEGRGLGWRAGGNGMVRD
jgi:hypothetical protein